MGTLSLAALIVFISTILIFIVWRIKTSESTAVFMVLINILLNLAAFLFFGSIEAAIIISMLLLAFPVIIEDRTTN